MLNNGNKFWNDIGKTLQCDQLSFGGFSFSLGSQSLVCLHEIVCCFDLAEMLLTLEWTLIYVSY